MFFIKRININNTFARNVARTWSYFDNNYFSSTIFVLYSSLHYIRSLMNCYMLPYRSDYIFTYFWGPPFHLPIACKLRLSTSRWTLIKIIVLCKSCSRFFSFYIKNSSFTYSIFFANLCITICSRLY